MSTDHLENFGSKIEFNFEDDLIESEFRSENENKITFGDFFKYNLPFPSSENQNNHFQYNNINCDLQLNDNHRQMNEKKINFKDNNDWEKEKEIKVNENFVDQQNEILNKNNENNFDKCINNIINNDNSIENNIENNIEIKNEIKEEIVNEKEIKLIEINDNKLELENLKSGNKKMTIVKSILKKNDQIEEKKIEKKVQFIGEMIKKQKSNKNYMNEQLKLIKLRSINEKLNNKINNKNIEENNKQILNNNENNIENNIQIEEINFNINCVICKKIEKSKLKAYCEKTNTENNFDFLQSQKRLDKNVFKSLEISNAFCKSCNENHIVNWVYCCDSCLIEYPAIINIHNILINIA